jgi:RNA polymerase sigma-70 factor (ECF subfamily)
MKKRKLLSNNFVRISREASDSYGDDLHDVDGNGRCGKDRSDEKETLRLIEQIRTGDSRAFSELMNRYKSQVAGIAYRVVGDYDDAGDVTQLVFIKTAANLNRYDSSKRFSTWLYRITVNASIDYLRRHRRHVHEQLDNYAETLENLEASPAQIYHRKYLRYLILKAAEQLSARQRAAFVLKDMEGYDIPEVAKIMDMPEATVRWYIHRARLRLRRELRASLSDDPWRHDFLSRYMRN